MSKRFQAGPNESEQVRIGPKRSRHFRKHEKTFGNKEKLRKQEQNTPLKRIGYPQDISGIAHFLASDASAFITGQLIVADGGETIVSSIT